MVGEVFEKSHVLLEPFEKFWRGMLLNAGVTKRRDRSVVRGPEGKLDVLEVLFEGFKYVAELKKNILSGQ